MGYISLAQSNGAVQIIINNYPIGCVEVFLLISGAELLGTGVILRMPSTLSALRRSSLSTLLVSHQSLHLEG